jgi:hypothetical protein
MVRDAVSLSAVERAARVASAFGATALVIALELDAAIFDPESPLQVTGDRRAEDASGRSDFPPSWRRTVATICRTLGQPVGSAVDGLGSG